MLRLLFVRVSSIPLKSLSSQLHKTCVADMSMKAVVVHEYGDSSKLSYEDVPIPEPAKGEVLVKNHFCGVNFIDIICRNGHMGERFPLNATLGFEGSGVVEKVGSDVEGISKGDNVAYMGLGVGSYSEFSKVPSWRVIKSPQGVSLEKAASTLWQGLTAYCFTDAVFPIKPDTKVLIQGVAGGVGNLLCQLAKLKGAYVIGTCSTEVKAAKARAAGADEVILYSQKDFVEETKRLTDGKGVNVIYDGVGKTTFLKGFDCLAPRGTMVLFGGASGNPGPIDPTMLGKGSYFLTFASHFAYTSDPTLYRKMANELFQLVADGKIDFGSVEKIPLADAKESHDKLQNRKAAGKILLVP
ncbi:uncharacterized protein LOC116307088 [Actinia tenebrosa]|uniref:Uncharacterized protein LOC116307088 n=1 Tax=Actinia tenebrosa TaxID=6105 RepID=A0A6P8J0U0_ACTTE|nr:uncharacterized protein LOC116307088 [Actinia tenebrosa]